MLQKFIYPTIQNITSDVQLPRRVQWGQPCSLGTTLKPTIRLLSCAASATGTSSRGTAQQPQPQHGPPRCPRRSRPLHPRGQRVRAPRPTPEVGPREVQSQLEVGVRLVLEASDAQNELAHVTLLQNAQSASALPRPRHYSTFPQRRIFTAWSPFSRVFRLQWCGVFAKWQAFLARVREHSHESL